ncbi:hypothetical protein EW145_g6478 [Phellinidium pouzarii]|uniref:Lipid droplet-associated perilipin protein n=1 Tax=Phellinidium pouzarii TaxID=167371 RepID=A0A4S4KWP9_9AGAM|nr:hypothetical protein EW145_g6478 [Phellinidium pouzarii]
MATETQTMPSTPEQPQLTVLTRVASIPLISDSLAAVHAALTGNVYTKSPYTTAQAWGSAAFRASDPIQARLAPVLVRADDFANKAVDVLESRYPYPFHAPTEEIYSTLRKRSEHVYGVANKTIDDNVRAPAYGLVQGIDQKFTPVVDRFESVVGAFNGKKTGADGPEHGVSAAEPPKDTFQYQRAYRLSLGLKDTLYIFTGEQIKQIQEHNVIVQRATATAQSISSALSTSYSAAFARVHALSDTMLTELNNLQASAATLPATVQASLGGLTERVGGVIGEVKGVLSSEAPVADKLAQLRATVEQQVQPLLSGATARVHDAMSAVRTKSAPSSPHPTTNGTTVIGNGNVH